MRQPCAKKANHKVTKVCTKFHKALEMDDWPDARDRQKRTVRDMEYQMQRVLSLSEWTRDQNFWQTLKGDTTGQHQRNLIIKSGDNGCHGRMIFEK